MITHLSNDKDGKQFLKHFTESCERHDFPQQKTLDAINRWNTGRGLCIGPVNTKLSCASKTQNKRRIYCKVTERGFW